MNHYPNISRVRLLVDRKGWNSRVDDGKGVLHPAGTIGVITSSGGGWYVLQTPLEGFVDVEHHDVEPACSMAFNHALDEGWITKDEWMIGLIASISADD
jgi:hypothetical protein